MKIIISILFIIIHLLTYDEVDMECYWMFKRHIDRRGVEVNMIKFTVQ